MALGERLRQRVGAAPSAAGDRELAGREVALGLGDVERQVLGGGDRPAHRDGERGWSSTSHGDHGAPPAPATSKTSRAMRSAASGTARLRARSPMRRGRRVRAGGARRPPRAAQASGRSAGKTHRAPAASTSRALAVCSSPLAPGSGTYSAGRPSWQHSFTVPAPLRPTTRVRGRVDVAELGADVGHGARSGAEGAGRSAAARREPGAIAVRRVVATLVHDLADARAAAAARPGVAVEPVRALRPAGDVDDRQPASKAEAPAAARARAAGQLRAERVAGERRSARPGAAAGQREGQRDAPGEAGGHPVGKAGHGGLLVDDHGNAERARGERGRQGDEAARWRRAAPGGAAAGAARTARSRPAPARRRSGTFCQSQ